MRRSLSDDAAPARTHRRTPLTINHDVIATTASGRPIYDNAVTCVVMQVLVAGRLLLVRRNIPPGVGLLALPGGFQMRGETWQEAGIREVSEETGYEVDPASVTLVDVVTAPNGVNLIFGRGLAPVEPTGAPDPVEVQLLRFALMRDPLPEWAFPLHYHSLQGFPWP